MGSMAWCEWCELCGGIFEVSYPLSLARHSPAKRPCQDPHLLVVGGVLCYTFLGWAPADVPKAGFRSKIPGIVLAKTVNCGWPHAILGRRHLAKSALDSKLLACWTLDFKLLAC